MLSILPSTSAFSPLQFNLIPKSTQQENSVLPSQYPHPSQWYHFSPSSVPFPQIILGPSGLRRKRSFKIGFEVLSAWNAMGLALSER